MELPLSPSEAKQIADILARRANDVAGFHMQHRETCPGSVELALSREIDRLRRLESKIRPIPPTDPEDEE